MDEKVAEKLLKLAQAAESLADDCEAGTGPILETDYCFKDGSPCCAFGHALSRANLIYAGQNVIENRAAFSLLVSKDSDLMKKLNLGAIANANDHTPSSGRPSAVIEPLRNFATKARAAANSALPNLQD